MGFLDLKQKVFGLDISDLSFKIIKLKRKRNDFYLSFYLEKDIPAGVIKDGEINDEKRLVEIIKNVLIGKDGKKIKTKYVIASLPDKKSFLQMIQMPKISVEDLKSAIIYEAENYIPLPIDDVYLDFEKIPSSNQQDHYDILIAASPKKTIDSYLSCLKKSGLIPIALEIESLSIARALIKNNDPLLYFLIDFGATKTNFIVFFNNFIRFTVIIPISSNMFTEAISKSLGISFEEAEELKIKFGLEKKEIFQALIPILADFKEQIKKYIDYYYSLSGQEKIGTILFSGNGANLKGLINFFISELKIPISLGNPLINILKKPLSKISYEQALGYTTAIGLALKEKEIENNKND